MKCSFCGKELEAGAEFCPECGMILSLGDIDTGSGADDEIEVPEFTPNIFHGDDIEEQIPQPAMELEVKDEEEFAPVVEGIPEYVTNEEAVEDGFAAEDSIEPVAAEEEKEDVIDIAETGFAPPEYDATPIVVNPEDVVIEKVETPVEEAVEEEVPVVEEAAPEQETLAEAVVEEEKKKPIHDDSLIEALFDSVTVDDDDEEEYEDITNKFDKPEKTKKKSSNTGYAMVFLLVAVLVGIIFAAGHIYDNVLPSIREKASENEVTDVDATADSVTDESDESKETTSKKDTSSTESTKVSTLPGLMTTTKADSSTTTTKSSTTASTSTTKSTTTLPALTATTNSSTLPSSYTTTTRPTTTTTRPTTTTTRPTTEATTTTRPATTTTTTQATTESYTFDANVQVQSPSSYNIDETIVYPSYNAIDFKVSPSSSAANIYTLSYGYYLTAYALQNGYYYVYSHRYGLYGWVSASDVYEYVEETTTAAQTTTAQTTTTAATVSDYKEFASSYDAVVNSDVGLNVRTGPGTGYGVSVVLPYGYTVTVKGYSATDSDWVYVTVTDSSYPYGSPSGWVHSDYLS